MTSEKAQISQASEAFRNIHNISQLLSTGLDAETLSICIKLLELGVNPEALAVVVKEVKKMKRSAQNS